MYTFSVTVSLCRLFVYNRCSFIGIRSGCSRRREHSAHMSPATRTEIKPLGNPSHCYRSFPKPALTNSKVLQIHKERPQTVHRCVHYLRFDQNLFLSRNQSKYELSRSGVVVTFSPSKRERWVRFPPATLTFCSTLQMRLFSANLEHFSSSNLESKFELVFFGPPPPRSARLHRRLH